MSIASQLYFIAWQGEACPPAWNVPAEVEALLARGHVQKTTKGYVATDAGRAALSGLARTACQRPTNYADLSGEEQWAIDKRLGILDWDGD